MNMVIYKFNIKDLYFTWPTHLGLRVKDKIRSISQIIWRWLLLTSNQIRLGELREEIRHNLQTEGLQGGTLKETVRHNVADEGIRMFTARSNDYIGRANVDVSRGQLAVAGLDAATRRIDAGTRQGELAVHSSEANTKLGQLAVSERLAKVQEGGLAETSRHNVKTEKQQDFRNTVEAIGTGGEVLEDVTKSAKNVVDLVPGFTKLLKGGK